MNDNPSTTGALSLDTCVELMHFSFRSIISEPDKLLRQRGLNRSHHRILHFIGRSDGLRLNRLLQILGVSRQALHRPLKQLAEQGLVEMTQLAEDRRNYRLVLTAEGRALERSLTGPQKEMFIQARAELGEEALKNWAAVMAILSRGTPWDNLPELLEG